MSVCIVGEFPPPPGGMAVQADLLSRNLRGDGLRVRQVRTNRSFGGIAAALGKVPVVRSVARFFVFNGALLRRTTDSSVFHVLSNSYLSFFLFTLPPLVVARLSGRKVVVNYHGGAADEFLARWPSAKAALRLADRIVVPSGYLRQIFEKHGLKASVVPNVCDLDRFRFAERKDPVPVLVVARHLEPVYNVACALRAFAIVKKERPAARLIVAGGGSQSEELRKLAAGLGISEAVSFLGDVKNEDMPRIYAQADFFVNSSSVDNAPMAILEAFACGLPVVSTRAGGIPYLVEDGRTGLLVGVNDHEALAESVLSLVRSPERAAELVRNARAEAERYRWPSVRGEWMQIYLNGN